MHPFQIQFLAIDRIADLRRAVRSAAVPPDPTRIPPSRRPLRLASIRARLHPQSIGVARAENAR